MEWHSPKPRRVACADRLPPRGDLVTLARTGIVEYDYRG
jgi:hypothetical protein